MPLTLAEDETLPNHETPNLQLQDSQDPFSNKTIRKLKSYLARGIALQVKMNFDFKMFENYDGRSILYQQCTA